MMIPNNWPGLAKEAKRICEELKIEDANETNKSKKEFKADAKAACLAKDEEVLRRLASKSKKCERIMEEGFGKKWNITPSKISIKLESFSLQELA